MARFNNGWIKLHRKAWDSDLGQNVFLWAIWTGLLHLATWQESKIIWQGKQRTLPPGSVVFGLAEISERWECSRSVLQKWLHYLHDSERIVLESCSRGTLVTIRKWAEYQAHDDEACSPRGNGVFTARLPRVSGEALNEESKNEEYVCAADFLKSCKETWKQTLTHFGITRSISQAEETLIARAIKEHGVETVDLALFGARFEPKTDNFDPKSHVSISRVLDKDRTGKLRIDKFTNLGAQAREQFKPRQVVGWES